MVWGARVGPRGRPRGPGLRPACRVPASQPKSLVRTLPDPSPVYDAAEVAQSAHIRARRMLADVELPG